MYEIWDKSTGFNLADGTPCKVEEIHTRYPFTRSGTIIIEKLPNGNVGAIDSLDIIKQVFGVEAEDDTEALAAIESARSAPAKVEVTAQADTDAMLVDLEYRLTLLELGVPEGV